MIIVSLSADGETETQSSWSQTVKTKASLWLPTATSSQFTVKRRLNSPSQIGIPYITVTGISFSYVHKRSLIESRNTNNSFDLIQNKTVSCFYLKRATAKFTRGPVLHLFVESHPLDKAALGPFSEMSLTIHLNLSPPTETLFVYEGIDVEGKGKCASFISFKNKRRTKAQ